MCMLVGAAPSDSQGSDVAAHQSREVLDGLMAGPRPGLPAPTSGKQPSSSCSVSSDDGVQPCEGAAQLPRFVGCSATQVF